MGGCGTEAAKVWSELAKTHALATGELRATVLSRFLQSCSIILHRENARSILRHPMRPDAMLSSSGVDGSAAALLTSAAADSD